MSYSVSNTRIEKHFLSLLFYAVSVALPKYVVNIVTQAPPEPPVERKHVVDAAIVRVMKARKQLDHNTLLEEVFRQCTLSPAESRGVHNHH